jgi:hypothetical protein
MGSALMDTATILLDAFSPLLEDRRATQSSIGSSGRGAGSR